jgi:prepilin-type N-terminal cleavage/methylation domain-containing protein
MKRCIQLPTLPLNTCHSERSEESLSGIRSFVAIAPQYDSQKGFTLIEMSIVLVVIGLIIGGILVGRDLIKAAEVTAQISQITKYNSAVNIFRNKYGGLPGDLPATLATQFGFAACGTGAGQGDGNGIIQGAFQGAYGAYGFVQGYGETATFWVDLSAVGMIEGTFNTASETALPGSDVTGSNLSLYFPQAKIGGGNYVYVWSGVTCCTCCYTSGVNYFGIAAITDISISSQGKIENTGKTISVQQAYNIDKKMDDGLPLTGSVTTAYVTNDPYWTNGTDMIYSTAPTQVAEGSGSCFDNGNVNGTTMQYSLGVTTGNGSNLNCALSFRFQ